MLDELITDNPFVRGGRILVEHQVFQGIQEFRQRTHSDTEAGGILLGFRRDPHLHITEFTSPQRCDTRSRFGFGRIDPTHQKIALRSWSKSGKRLDYVGEWHTHPEPTPRPSKLDEKEWRQILAKKVDCMMFVIVGNADCLWAGIGLKKIIRPISFSEYTK